MGVMGVMRVMGVMGDFLGGGRRDEAGRDKLGLNTGCEIFSDAIESLTDLSVYGFVN